MLTSYKKISVIYGGNGRKYASQIKDKLQDLHEKEFYPIKIEDLNTDWVGHDVLGTVVKTIRNSDLIYIVFTLTISAQANAHTSKTAMARLLADFAKTCLSSLVWLSWCATTPKKSK